MKNNIPNIGDRVQLKRNIDRFPHFIAEAGNTGTVIDSSERIIYVRFDDYIPGADEWNNEVDWIPEYDPENGLDGFWDDCDKIE